jgi:hypothetical protein
MCAIAEWSRTTRQAGNISHHTYCIVHVRFCHSFASSLDRPCLFLSFVLSLDRPCLFLSFICIVARHWSFIASVYFTPHIIIFLFVCGPVYVCVCILPFSQIECIEWQRTLLGHLFCMQLKNKEGPSPDLIFTLVALCVSMSLTVTV